jgi:NIPSNAP
MIYELRHYRLASTAMIPAHDRHMGRILELFNKYGFRLHGAWNQMLGEHMPAHRYILKWDSLAQREQAFAKLYADPRWAGLLDRLVEEAGGQVVTEVSVSFHAPAGYWPEGAAQ